MFYELSNKYACRRQSPISGPVDQFEALSALEVKRRKIPDIDREYALQSSLVGEPDERSVGEIDFPVRVLPDGRRQFGIAQHRHFDHRKLRPDRIEQIDSRGWL